MTKPGTFFADVGQCQIAEEAGLTRITMHRRLGNPQMPLRRTTRSVERMGASHSGGNRS
ncbi:hypothetical protein SAMN05216489_00438 [Streptomyces sp. 3213]|nr:hypothetical protein SAMN05216489_00438 [Streptomyces sp. 3213] [Streptomyces sp. 3213.3]